MKKKALGYSDRKTASLFLLCWFAYFSTYICRLNFSAVMPRLLEDGFTQSQIASVSSAFFICYGLFQLVSGELGDRFSPRLMIFLGVFISGVSNLLIFLFHSSYEAILLLWAVNGAVQSMVWSPILRVGGEYFLPEEKDKFGVDLSTTVPLGTLASYAVSLVTLMALPWKYVFLTCGCTVIIAAVIWLAGTKRLIVAKTGTNAGENENSVSKAVPLGKLFRITAKAGVLLLLISIAIQGTLKDSVTQWIPTFLESEYGADASVSLALTMLLPVINVTGAYFAKAVNKRVNNEILTSLIFFAVAAGLLAVLLLSRGSSMVLSLLLMAGVTNCMFAINVMIITMVPLRFSSMGRTSTVGGFLNAMAYVGCGILNLGAGRLLEKSGSSWNMLFIMWLALAFIALAVTFFCISPWKKFLSENK